MSAAERSCLPNVKTQHLQGDASDLRKPLQPLIEAHLDTPLGIRFLASLPHPRSGGCSS